MEQDESDTIELDQHDIAFVSDLLKTIEAGEAEIAELRKAITTAHTRLNHSLGAVDAFKTTMSLYLDTKYGIDGVLYDVDLENGVLRRSE